jgi:hypothetical protein
VTPVSATAFGPGGTSDGDNPQDASLVLSGSPVTPWHTDWYATASFGNLKAGTGLPLDLGRTLTITGAAIRLGNIPGGSRDGGQRRAERERPADSGGWRELQPAEWPHTDHPIRCVLSFPNR